MLGRDRTTTLSAADAAEVSIRGVVQMTSQSQEPDRRRTTEASHTSSSSSSSSQKCHIILNLSVALLSVLMCVCVSLSLFSVLVALQLVPRLEHGGPMPVRAPVCPPLVMSVCLTLCLSSTISLTLSLWLCNLFQDHMLSLSLWRCLSVSARPPARPSISVLLWLCHLFKTSSHSPPLIFRAQVKYNPHLAADAATAGDAGDGCRCCC